MHIHPAVFKKSVDLPDCKGVLKHSLVKERKERAESVWLRASRDSKLRAEFLVRKTDAPPPPCFCASVTNKGVSAQKVRKIALADSERKGNLK
jgi:hypothetical protein